MPSNLEKLGSTLLGQMKRMNSSNAKTAVELASIKKGFSLAPDDSPGPIPKGEYSVCGNVSEKLKAGDRVLIVWCGTEPVVVDVIE